jgi:hypothetical protein
MSKQKRINHERPSPDTLAGVYVCVEGEEEVLVAPRKDQRPAEKARRKARKDSADAASENGSGVE